MKKSHNYIVIDDDSTSNLICEFTIKKFDKDANIQLFWEPEAALFAIEKGLCIEGEPTNAILFLDVNMPAMTGFEFLDEFQKFPREIREQFIIYMLTSSIEDFSEQAEQYPFVAGFLSKPLKVNDLVHITEKQMDFTLDIQNRAG